MNDIGSTWRKCDLHLHSLYTHLTKGYKGVTQQDYIEKIKNSGLEVVGLTNYFNFNAEDYVLKTKLEEAGIVVFLNLELRLANQNKEEQSCDLHVVFHNDVTQNEISDILAELMVKVGPGTEAAKNLKSEEDFNKGVVEFDQLMGVLSNPAWNLGGRHLIGFLSRGKGNIRSATVYEHIVKKSHFVIHSSDSSGNLIEDRQFWLGHDKPLIQSSDAHCIDQIGTKYCWVKARPTFEGLKQIQFEPANRVDIGTDKPIAPLNRIEKIQFNIPDDATIGGDAFCFAGENKAYHLSPYFNCFIGGRGSGKSTILSFMGQNASSKDGGALEYFWNNMNPSFEHDSKSVFDLSGTKQFEFLGQSQIESFAKNETEFTKAIYDRANIQSNYSLEKHELEADRQKTVITSVIKSIGQAVDYGAKIKKHDEKIETLSSSMEFMESDEYKEITDDIKGKSNKLRGLLNAQARLSEFKQKVDEIIEHEQGDIEAEANEAGGIFQTTLNQALAKLKKVAEFIEGRDVADTEKQIESLGKAIAKRRLDITSLLEESGLSQENIHQAEAAPQAIADIQSQIATFKKELKKCTDIIGQLDEAICSVEEARSEYERDIEGVIEPLVAKLEERAQQNAGEVKSISLRYRFNHAKAWQALAEEFYSSLSTNERGNERRKDVEDFIAEEKEHFDGSQEDITKYLSDREEHSQALYIKFLSDIFKNGNNYKLFTAIKAKHLNDIKEYKLIEVLYDNVPVMKASFGQRCTAVIVILLLFGNFPIIIDEPEAHLDSALIANYLVPLIKETKANRQIIFATHNANFVINGDAEKIFILDNPAGKTQIMETTIEDLEYRESLIKLEGSKQAFERRGDKFGLPSRRTI